MRPLPPTVSLGRVRRRRYRSRMRRVLLVAVIAAVLAACGEPTPPVTTEVDRRAAEFARLNARMTVIAEAQSSADPLLATQLESLREFDASVEALRDPERVDAVKDDALVVAEALDASAVDDLRDRYREVAFAVDDARNTLGRARREVSDDWERQYLDAQDEVLSAVRDYAEEADALVQVIGTYWDVYAAVRDETATFVKQRWFYRTPQEAADAYELAISDHLDRLMKARATIAEFASRRDAAAVAVNQATADAAQVWASRRAGASAGSSTGP